MPVISPQRLSGAVRQPMGHQLCGLPQQSSDRERTASARSSSYSAPPDRDHAAEMPDCKRVDGTLRPTINFRRHSATRTRRGRSRN